MKKTKAIKTNTGLDVKAFNDKWSQLQEKLESVAQEQVAADIEVVQTSRALKAAEAAHKKAIARKTLAEKRLGTLRGNLGAE